MPPRSRATALDGLAPDQRAAVELVLLQGRSYGELAELLGMPEETIRSRVRSGLEGLAPDLPAPPRAGEIADWLLAQQAEAQVARTRELLLSDPAAHRWATTVAAPLRDVAGADSVPALPALPTGTDPPEPHVNGTSARPRPLPKETAAREAGEAAPSSRRAKPPADGDGSAAASDEAPRRAAPLGGSSRLGGAILIGAAVLLVGAVLAFVFLRGDDSTRPAAESDAAPAAATAVATATPASNDILLRGRAGSKAVGLMRLFGADDGTVRFALAAQGVAPNQGGETYSVWFRKQNGSARLIGDVKDPVGESGELASAGPGNDDVDDFPQWLISYDTMLVTRDAANAKEPGTVILSGDLPRAGTG